MKVFIPAIGTRLKLIQPWSFTLYQSGPESFGIYAGGEWLGSLGRRDQVREV